MDSRDEWTAGTTEDLVFFALADPTRRQLLDHLHARDGQRLGELCVPFRISRQAVRKHLGVLHGAGLIAERQHGRQTVYFLNRAPIRLIDRNWIGKFVRDDFRVDCS